MCEFERNYVDAEEYTKGGLGAHAKNKLRFIDKLKDVINNNIIEINDVILTEEVWRGIEWHEVIAAKMLEKICVWLHSPEVQIKVLKEDAMALLEDAKKDEMKGLKGYVDVHRITVYEATREELLS